MLRIQVLRRIVPILEYSPAERWYFFTFWGFALYLALFPIGYGFREVIPPVCFLCLCMYWHYDWTGSVLHAFPYKWGLWLFALFLCLSVVFSTDVWASFIHVGRGVNKQFMSFFVALECARNKTSLRRLAFALLLGCYLEGLACLYQYFTGYDFIYGYPLLNGRLTGTMASYWVGNYLLLASVPAWALCRYVYSSLGKGFGFFCITAIAWPIMFGIYFAAARAAYVSGFAVMCFAFFWKEKAPRKKILFYLALAILVLMAGLWFFGKNRFALHTILTDARLILWMFSIEVFETSIWTGVGAWQYSTVLQTLEIARHWSEGWITTSHPHNAYLQVLCETGIIGFSVCFGVLFFLFYKIIQGVREGLLTEKAKSEPNSFWHLTFYFAMGCLAFFVHFLFGHDFFRPWYQALFMMFLGISVGAVVSNRTFGTKSEM